MLAHLAVSFPVRRLVARLTELQERGELFEREGRGPLRAPMVRSSRDLQLTRRVADVEGSQWWTAGGHGVRMLGVGLSASTSRRCAAASS